MKKHTFDDEEHEDAVPKSEEDELIQKDNEDMQRGEA